MKYIIFIIPLSLIFISTTYGQNSKKTDSLYNAIDKSKYDTARVNLLLELISEIEYNEPDKAISLSNDALKISTEINFERRKITIYNHLGICYYLKSDYSKSFENFIQALKIAESRNDPNLIASMNTNVGNVYYAMNELNRAMAYYKKAIIEYRKQNKLDDIGSAYANFGNIYQRKDMLDSSEFFLDSAIFIGYKLGDKTLLGNAYNSKANIYYSKRDFKKALELYTMSLNYKKEIGNRNGIISTTYNIGKINLELKNLPDAEKYLLMTLKESEEIGANESKSNCLNILAFVNYEKGKYKEAFEYMKNYTILHDSIFSSDFNNKMADLQTKYETEKKDAEIKEKNAQIKEKNLQMKQLYYVVSGILLVLLIAIYAYIQKRKDNKKIRTQKILIEESNVVLNQQNEEIIAQRDEIEAQRDLVTIQKEHIEEIHKEVTDSINYATRIQTAILPDPDILQKYLSESFVLFKPKDKVSGDFYWWTQVENNLIITIADCTGHGVPGAFMSMLGISFLREIVVKEYMTNPAIILKRLRKEIIHALKQKGITGEQKDGMDIALITINTTTLEMQFAGANNPIYIISGQQSAVSSIDIENCQLPNTHYRFLELKGDKMPIAIHERMDPFSNNDLKLSKDDRLYLFTDGYADQFGGPKGKKFMYKQFKEKILSHYQEPMSKQKEILEKTINDWIDTGEQVDDITVLGIKI